MSVMRCRHAGAVAIGRRVPVLLLVLALAAVSGCGKKAPVKPAEGQPDLLQRCYPSGTKCQ